jgi:hypothetical protein
MNQIIKNDRVEFATGTYLTLELGEEIVLLDNLCCRKWRKPEHRNESFGRDEWFAVVTTNSHTGKVKGFWTKAALLDMHPLLRVMALEFDSVEAATKFMTENAPGQYPGARSFSVVEPDANKSFREEAARG